MTRTLSPLALKFDQTHVFLAQQLDGAAPSSPSPLSSLHSYLEYRTLYIRIPLLPLLLLPAHLNLRESRVCQVPTGTCPGLTSCGWCTSHSTLALWLLESLREFQDHCWPSTSHHALPPQHHHSLAHKHPPLPPTLSAPGLASSSWEPPR